MLTESYGIQYPTFLTAESGFVLEGVRLCTDKAERVLLGKVTLSPGSET